MNASRITCLSMPEFIEVIVKLTRENIVFRAYTCDLTITIIGY